MFNKIPMSLSLATAKDKLKVNSLKFRESSLVLITVFFCKDFHSCYKSYLFR
jgi:hypothetical protein